MGTEKIGGQVDDLAESTWAFAVLCASAESGLLAALASPQRVEEAAETSGMPAEIAARVLDVLVALRFARRSGDSYESVDGLKPTLTDEAIGQLLANLRTTYKQSRDLVDRAKLRRLSTGWMYTDPDPACAGRLRPRGGAGARGAGRAAAAGAG
jgi:hypothetical protein